MAYYQPEIETASREQIHAWQEERFLNTFHRVWNNNAYYRQKMIDAGLSDKDVTSLDDLKKLPFLTKDDLRDAYPFGLMSATLSDCVRIHSTSGTTGKRVIAFYTEHDLALWDDICARAIVAAGGTRDDIVQVCYGYGLFTGGLGLHGGSQKVGCLTLPMSSGNTDRQLQFMEDLGSTILCCTPSYAAYLAESIHERGLENKIHLKAGIFGAEAWTDEMRHTIEASLGIKAYDIYGLTELSGPGVAYECEAQTGMHINEDHFIAEIIDPKTGERTENITVYDANGNETYSTVDVTNERGHTVSMDGERWEWTYDDAAHTSTCTRPDGSVDYYQFDEQGRVLSEKSQDPDGDLREIQRTEYTDVTR